MAAQTQSLRTNTIRANIDKTQEDSKFRMCKQKEETVSHIVSECPKLAQREYKRVHNLQLHEKFQNLISFLKNCTDRESFICNGKSRQRFCPRKLIVFNPNAVVLGLRT